jgi:hypothetical protein
VKFTFVVLLWARDYQNNGKPIQTATSQIVLAIKVILRLCLHPWTGQGPEREAQNGGENIDITGSHSIVVAPSDPTAEAE